MPARRLQAAWLLPIDAPPIPGGALLVDGDGRIAAAGPDTAVPSPPGVPVERWPDAAILPGFVNTHTHLELTGFAGAVTAENFPGWIRGIREVKASRAPADYLAAARQGLADCHAAGVTTVADTGDTGAAMWALAEGRGRGIFYQEVFGPHPAQCADSLAGLQARVAELRGCVSERVRLGVSPHAPYSVSGPLYRAVARWARDEGLPMAVHLAESPEESALLATGEGAFADMWRRREIPLPPLPGCSPVAWLDAHEVLGPETLCIHVVQAAANDIALLASHGCAVAHCPLSNAAHHHGAAPLAALLDAGLRVGLGTDSVVSVGTLDLLAEARAARALAARAAAPLSAAATLELLTAAGARALGLAHEVGTLAPGKWADCTVMRLDRAGTGDTAQGIEERVLASGPRDVVATFVAGHEVHRADRQRL